MAQRAAGFILLPLYTTLLTTAEYGALEIFYSIAAVLTSILGVGLAHATLRFYFEYNDKTKAKQVVSTNLLATATIAGALALGVSFLAESFVDYAFDGLYINGFYIILATLVLELLRQIGFAYFRAREYSVRYVMTSFGQLIIQLTANIYLIAFLDMGVVGVLLGNLISVIAGTSYVLWVTIKECKLKFNVPIFKDIFFYSYPFVFNALISVVVQNADRFIIRHFFSLEAVGTYALAMKFAQILKILVIESFQLGFGSFRFSIIKQGNAKELIAKIGTYYALLVFTAGLGVSIFCPEAIDLMATDSYLGAAAIVPFLVASICVNSYGYIFQTGILYSKQTKRMVKITILHSISLIGLELLLIPNYGAYGAAWSILGSSFVYITATYKYSHSLFPMNYHFGRLGKIYIISLTTFALSMLVTVDNLLLSITYKLFCILVFVILILASKVFYGDEWLSVKKYIQKT